MVQILFPCRRFGHWRSPCRWLVVVLLSAWVAIGCAPTVPKPVTPTAGCRVVTHLLGESCIPAAPQRIVTIGVLEETLALGLQPVGAAIWVAGGGVGDFPAYLGDRTAGITNLGNTAQPNLETLLGLHPDLIIGTSWGTASVYGQLTAIAPTVVLDYEDADWKSFLQQLAVLLHRSEQATAALRTYEQRLQTFQQGMGDRLAHTVVSLLRSSPGGLRIYMAGSFSGSILADAGLPRPPAQQQDKWFEDVSLESIPDMAGDVIFVAHDDPHDTFLTQAQSHPLWQQLEAVQQERVYAVSHEHWIGGSSLLAANRALDDLFDYLLEQNP